MGFWNSDEMLLVRSCDNTDRIRSSDERMEVDSRVMMTRVEMNTTMGIHCWKVNNRIFNHWDFGFKAAQQFFEARRYEGIVLQ